MDCLVYLFIMFIFSAIGYKIGQQKNINPWLGAVGGFFLGPLVFLVFLITPGKPKRKCPQCAEEIQEEARVCKHCKYEFPNTTGVV